ncbi:MAG: hypothetical protein PHD30_03310 [Paludibacter sp.]|nr:hypothetical protein [Paludibacter sp.]
MLTGLSDADARRCAFSGVARGVMVEGFEKSLRSCFEWEFVD